MTTTGILPQPASTYQLLLDAARTWPDSAATQWIPDPSEYTRCLAWTYAGLAGTVTQIANALIALGVRRPDAVTLSAPNTSMLYAATLAAQLTSLATDRTRLAQLSAAALLRSRELTWRAAGLSLLTAYRPQVPDRDPSPT